MRKKRPSVLRIGSSFVAWNFARISVFLPAGIFAPRPSILMTLKNGRNAALNSVTASSVAVRKPMRSSCRRLTRDRRPPATIEVSSCGRITSSLRRREALVRLRQRPRCIKVHARAAKRRTDDREHEHEEDRNDVVRDQLAAAGEVLAREFGIAGPADLGVGRGVEDPAIHL